jgi:hypothetical protein
MGHPADVTFNTKPGVLDSTYGMNPVSFGYSCACVLG